MIVIVVVVQALFLGRAVVDEVLPPAFLVSVLPALPDSSLGVTVVHAAGIVQLHVSDTCQTTSHIKIVHMPILVSPSSMPQVRSSSAKVRPIMPPVRQ